MRLKNTVPIILCLLLALSSCGIYRQNVVNAPLFQHKGQLRLGAHVSPNGYEGHAAYSLTNRIGVLGNFGVMKPERDQYSVVSYREDRHRFGEVGIGIFKRSEPANGNKVREIFLLAGKGFSSKYHQSYDSLGNLKVRFKQANYTRYCVQADFASIRHKVGIVLSPRLFIIHYFNRIDTFDFTDFSKLSSTHLYAEGAISLRYSPIRHLTFLGQYCITVPVTSWADVKSSYYGPSPLNISFGMIFNLNLIKHAP